MRIENKGVEVVQINTEGTCHLDAGMIEKAWSRLEHLPIQLLFIENVGNLVCPAEFDLGEDIRVVVLSTTEGHDKVLKYPLVFQQAQVVVLNKIDLLPYTDFDLNAFNRDLQLVNPQIRVFQLSGRTGEGLAQWTEWLVEEVGKRVI
jgi:hydrogenase nickel incorporation protein HypB